MDDLIKVFLDTYLTEELRSDVHESFNLFEFYGYDQAYTGMIDILASAESLGSETLQDSFLAELNDKLDFVLKEHTIVPSDTATISDKNEILRAFARIQNLEDYTGIIRLLESLESDEYQLSNIIAELSILDEVQVVQAIESFDHRLLAKLKEYIYAKEVPDSLVGIDPILKNLKSFFKILGTENAGYSLVHSGVLVGGRFITYLAFLEEGLIVSDNTATALNILSILYMSSDGYNNPILTYRKYSSTLFTDINLISTIEVLILKHIAKFSEVKAAKDESNRLSQTSGKA